MQKIAAWAVVSFLGAAAIFGSTTHARAAELAETQWSVLFPDTHGNPLKSALPFASALASRTPCNCRSANAGSPLRAAR